MVCCPGGEGQTGTGKGLRGAEVIGKEWKQKQARPWGETEDGGIKTRAGKTGMDGDKEKGEG